MLTRLATTLWAMVLLILISSAENSRVLVRSTFTLRKESLSPAFDAFNDPSRYTFEKKIHSLIANNGVPQQNIVSPQSEDLTSLVNLDRKTSLKKIRMSNGSTASLYSAPVPMQSNRQEKPHFNL